jgi:hypothetical protein
MYRPTNEQLARMVLSDSDRISGSGYCIDTRHRRTVWSHLPEVIHGAVKVVPPFFQQFGVRLRSTQIMHDEGSVTSNIWCGGPSSTIVGVFVKVPCCKHALVSHSKYHPGNTAKLVSVRSSTRDHAREPWMYMSNQNKQWSHPYLFVYTRFGDTSGPVGHVFGSARCRFRGGV